METQKRYRTKVVKQEKIYEPIMCCASSAKVNEIGEKVIHKHGNIETGMPVFMDDICSNRGCRHKKNNNKLQKMETEKNIQYGLKKVKYMAIITGREKQEQIE